MSAAGCRELLALLGQYLPPSESLLVLIEATGVLHLNWAAALTKGGYCVAVINPLMARRLYTLKNSIRENKTDPVDARGLCALAALYGTELMQKYRFTLQPERLALQRPISSSEAPLPYTSEVSIMVPPASTNASRIAKARNRSVAPDGPSR